MTFCLAFAANPDGIAVIADTRITFDKGYEDDYQKVIFPTNNSFLAVAGSVRTLKYMLEDISPSLTAVDPEVRIDVLRTRLRARFTSHLAALPGPTADDGASVIYGDVRLENGPTGCRLLRFEFGVAEGGPVFAEVTGKQFAETQATKFPDDPPDHLPWVCIGSYESLREFIGNTAMAHLREMLRRSLEVIPTDKSVAQGRNPYQQTDIRAATTPQGSGALIFNMLGTENGSFRKKLREYVNQQEQRGEQALLDPIYVLGMAAMKCRESA